jgi:sec-independent protein translocase protein TatB
VDIFGIGSSELIIILILATVILGPLRMIKVARELGKLIRDFRNYYVEFTKDFSQELALLSDPDEARPAQANPGPSEPAAVQPVSFSREAGAATEPAEANPIRANADASEPEVIQPASVGPEAHAVAEPGEADSSSSR